MPVPHDCARRLPRRVLAPAAGVPRPAGPRRHLGVPDAAGRRGGEPRSRGCARTSTAARGSGATPTSSSATSSTSASGSSSRSTRHDGADLRPRRDARRHGLRPRVRVAARARRARHGDRRLADPPPDRDERRAVHPRRRRASSAARSTRTRPHALQDRHGELFREMLPERRALPGAVSLLAALRAGGVVHGIATSDGDRRSTPRSRCSTCRTRRWSSSAATSSGPSPRRTSSSSARGGSAPRRTRASSSATRSGICSPRGGRGC